MMVLKILGIGLAIYALFLLIVYMNRFTVSVYRYEFFNKKNFILTTIAYACLYFGYQWYMKAQETAGDLLNGQVLIAIGALVVVYVVWENIQATDLIVGVVFSAIQLLLYVGISVLSLLLLIGAIAASAPYSRYGYYCDDDY